MKNVHWPASYVVHAHAAFAIRSRHRFRPKQVHGDVAWTHCEDDFWVACKAIAGRFCHESKLDGIIDSGWTPLADELDFKGGAHPREVASGGGKYRVRSHAW